MSHPIYNPPIPYTGIIPGGFWPGRLVRVHGSILPNANSFTLNLMTGPTLPNDDVGLHLSARFNEHWVVRNSKIYQNWGPEERQGHLPLTRGHNFELIILAEAQQFKIVMNGQHFAVYEYRLPVSRLTHFQIEGEAIVSSIQFEDPSLNYCAAASAPPMTMMPSSSSHQPQSQPPPPYHHHQSLTSQQSIQPQIGWALDADHSSSYPVGHGGGNGPQYFPPSYPPLYNASSNYPPPPHSYNGPASYPPAPGYVPPPTYPQPQAGYGGYNQGQQPYQQQPQQQSKGDGGPMKMVANGLNKVGLGSFANKIPGGGSSGGQQGQYPQQQGGHNNGNSGHSNGALIGTAAAAGIGGLVAGKALKKGKKKKKLIKYGVPIAGVALGGYALKKILD